LGRCPKNETKCGKVPRGGHRGGKKRKYDPIGKKKPSGVKWKINDSPRKKVKKKMGRSNALWGGEGPLRNDGNSEQKKELLRNRKRKGGGAWTKRGRQKNKSIKGGNFQKGLAGKVN